MLNAAWSHFVAGFRFGWGNLAWCAGLLTAVWLCQAVLGIVCGIIGAVCGIENHST